MSSWVRITNTQAGLPYRLPTCHQNKEMRIHSGQHTYSKEGCWWERKKKRKEVASSLSSYISVSRHPRPITKNRLTQHDSRYGSRCRQRRLVGVYSKYNAPSESLYKKNTYNALHFVKAVRLYSTKVERRRFNDNRYLRAVYHFPKETKGKKKEKEMPE